MKLYGITAERLILARNGTECIDYSGNKLEVVSARLNSCVLNNGETVLAQNKHLNGGAELFDKYKETLASCLNKNEISFDYFCLVDLLHHLKPVPTMPTRKYQLVAHSPYWYELNCAISGNQGWLTLQHLSDHQKIYLLKQLVEFGKDIDVYSSSVITWLYEDYHNLKALLEVDIPFEF